jgi:hypothetical protein
MLDLRPPVVGPWTDLRSLRSPVCTPAPDAEGSAATTQQYTRTESANIASPAFLLRVTRQQI